MVTLIGFKRNIYDNRQIEEIARMTCENEEDARNKATILCNSHHWHYYQIEHN